MSHPTGLDAAKPARVHLRPTSVIRSLSCSTSKPCARTPKPWPTAWPDAIFPWTSTPSSPWRNVRRQLITTVETKKSQRNAASAEVAKIKRQGGDAAHILAGLGELSESIKALDAQTKEVD